MLNLALYFVVGILTYFVYNMYTRGHWNTLWFTFLVPLWPLFWFMVVIFWFKFVVRRN